MQLFPDPPHRQLFVHRRMKMIFQCAVAISLALLCLGLMQPAGAEAFPIPIPVGCTTPCPIFNFDFTNPPQSLQPPYVVMDLSIPVNFLKPFVSLVVQIFSGRDGLNDGSGSGEIFFTAPQPSTGPGGTGVEFIAGAVGAQDGIFSIGISTDQAEAALLPSAPLATASAFVDTCFPPFCPTVTIAAVEFAPGPGPSVPGPDGLVLISVGAGAIGLLRRRRSHRTHSVASMKSLRGHHYPGNARHPATPRPRLGAHGPRGVLQTLKSQASSGRGRSGSPGYAEPHSAMTRFEILSVRRIALKDKVRGRMAFDRQTTCSKAPRGATVVAAERTAG